jgi:lipoprotein-anchoring transpeptidase ErfK/SrfK
MVRRTALGVVSGLGLLVAGLALAGCAQPAVGAAAAANVVVAPVTTTTQPASSRVIRPADDPVTQVPDPCAPSVMACVRLSTSQAWLRPAGKATVGPVSIGYGVGALATPVGSFQVSWKAEHWVSTEYNEPMPDAVFFAPGGIAFHAGSLDTNSHGCVHLAPAVAAEFYAVLQPGDSVQVLS